MSVQGPIFVVAFPGAGSAVLFEVLERARETVRLSDKSKAKLRESLAGAPGPEQTRTLRGIFREATKGTRRVVVSSLTQHGLSIATAHAVWPNARFLYLYRDAADHIAARHDVGTTPLAWEMFTQDALGALARLPTSAWCAVNYADLLEDAEGEAEWLGRMLGLTWPTAGLSHGPALQRHRALATVKRAGHEAASAGLPQSLLDVAQKAEALQQRHHAAWVLGDLAKARRATGSRGSLTRIKSAVVSSRVAAGVCLATALPQVARAATYQVTNLNDSGTGSLRAAIGLASSGNDVITFSSAANGKLTLTTGVLAVTKSVTIQGPGASALTIDGNNTSGVFYPYSKTTPINVTISGLTIQNGNSLVGGGISSLNTNLSVEDCVVQNNVSTNRGGGINANNSAGNANIAIVNTSVQTNHSSGSGGGINVAGTTTVAFSLVSSTVSGNTINGGSGAGVHMYGGTATLENSAILDNNNLSGTTGGLYFSSTRDLLVQNCNISGNSGTGDTGGLYAKGGGNAIIDSSTINNNTGTYGAGIQAWGSPLTITASTVANNLSTRGGGGIWMGSMPAGSVSSIVDCTVTGNTAQTFGGGVVVDANVVIEGSTIAGNTADGNGGGGVFVTGGKFLTIHNSIIANNTANAGPAQLSGTTTTSAISVAFSLVSDANDIAANSNVTIAANTNNILGQNPNLGTFGNHGGPTNTMVPAVTSPAVNAGDPNQAGLPTYDQRGLTRVVQGRVDMGSVELQTCNNSNTLEVGPCPSGTTSGGTTTAGTTTGSGGAAHGSSGCATVPGLNNTFVGAGFLAALTHFIRRRRAKNI